MAIERPQPYLPPERPGNGEPGTAPLLRNQDFQALWAGRFFAGLGKESGEVAYPLLILLLVGSASQAGIIGAAQVATTMITAVVGGVLADHVNRRTILLVCDLGRLLLLIGFTAILLNGEADVPLIIGVAVTSAALMGISNPVAMAAIKQLVPPSQIASASAQNQIRFFSTTALGAPLAGSLFGLGRAFPFLAEAICYLLSTALLLRIRRPMQAPRRAEGEPWTLRGTVTGFVLLARHPILRPMMCWIVGFNIAFTQTGVFLAIIATANERGASDLLVGVTVSLAGMGGLAGALVAGPVVRAVSPSRIFLFAAWAAPVCALVLAFTPGVLPLGVIVAFVFAAVPCVNAVFFGYVSATVPDRYQGRALGAVTFMALLSQPIGIVGVGVVFDLAGPVPVFLMMAVVSVPAALLTLGPTLRALPRPEEVAVL